MYSALRDYLTSPNPKTVEVGIVTFAGDYGLDDTVDELWGDELSNVIIGLSSKIEKDNILYSVWELELPNHELRITRAEDGDRLQFFKEQRIDREREVTIEHDLTMTKGEYKYSFEKRDKLVTWTKKTVRKFIQKVLSWHGIDL